MSDAADRTLPASPRRREAARRQGAVPPAGLLAWSAAAVTTILLLPAWAATVVPAFVAALRETIPRAVAAPGDRPGLADLVPPGVLVPTLGIVLAAGGAALVVRLVCDGIAFLPGRALPDLRRIDPGAGLARIVSVRTLLSACGDALGLTLLVAVAVVASGPLVGVQEAAPDPVAAAATAHRPLLAVVAAASVVAAVQWGFARWRFEQRIRMTPQEARDELRDAQATPQRPRTKRAARVSGLSPTER